MKLISPKLHGFLDNMTIIVLFLSPLVFDMDSVLALTVYLVAVLQFALTISTDYEYGLFKIIPFVIHGWIEVFMGCCFIVAALFFRHALNQQGFYYYAALAAIYLLVPALTRFRAAKYARDIRSVL